MIFVGVILFMAFLFKPVYAPKIDYSGEYGLDSKSAKGFYGLKTLLEKSVKRNLIKNELERVTDFSELSLNKMDTYNELKDILEYYNLNLND